MGKSSKLKQRAAETKEAEFQQHFAAISRRADQKPVVAPLVDEFAGYRDHFIRPPDKFVLRTRSDHRSKQALEMARYLFGLFRVPRILEQVWGAGLEADARSAPLPRVAQRTRLAHRPRLGSQGKSARENKNLKNVDFRAWFVCVATGGSLYKEHTKGLLTKKETHAFLEAPVDLDLCQAVLFAVAQSAAAPMGLALRLARSNLSNQPFDEFWFDAARFFCLPDHMPESLAQVNDLVDYLRHRHLEEPDFRLLGSSQSLPAILRRMEQWHRALARARDLSGVAWAGVDLPDFEIAQKDPEDKNRTVTWAVHQITTGKELAAEGSAQRHCVFGYKSRCAHGSCSIWSLTRTSAFGEKARRLTIEMDSFGNIVQKRGLANRQPRPEEEHILDQWALKAGLTNGRR